MPSPFPGMNPYLDDPDVWHDFHGVLVTLMRLQLAEQLAGRYQVRMDENVYLHELAADERRLLGRPVVHVVEGSTPSQTVATETLLLEAPVRGQLTVHVDELKERFIEIRDKSGQRLVTVIELLSPSNKLPGDDRAQYLAKRRRYLASDVSLVEIDLLRGGKRMPVEDLPACDYCVVVCPGVDRPAVGMWPLSLRDQLPDIPIPLQSGEQPTRLDLQQLVGAALDRGHYSDSIYDNPIDPPLSSDDADWVAKLLRRDAQRAT